MSYDSLSYALSLPNLNLKHEITIFNGIVVWGLHLLDSKGKNLIKIENPREVERLCWELLLEVQFWSLTCEGNSSFYK